MRRKTHERVIDDLRRAHARERDAWAAERRDLLDRIMYMADRPWSPPPEPVRTEPIVETDPIVWAESLALDGAE